jgi:hypothetical protein
VESKTNKTLTFPLPLRLDTINIEDQEEGYMLQLEERSWPKELHPPHIKTSRGEYQAQRCKNEHDTNLPLFAAAPYD